MIIVDAIFEIPIPETSNLINHLINITFNQLKKHSSNPTISFATSIQLVNNGAPAIRERNGWGVLAGSAQNRTVSN